MLDIQDWIKLETRILFIMTNKNKYRELCKKEITVPIFSQDWWLDVVCGEDNWDVVIIEKGGTIVASWPYRKNSKYGFKTMTMPQLTQHLGPWVKYPEKQKYAKKLEYEKEIFNKLIKLLPKRGFFQQNFHYSITNWLPFYWNEFQQTTRYTYVLEDLSDLDKVYGDFQSKNRTDISKAKNIVECIDFDDIEEFYEINKKTFARQNMEIPYSLDFIKNLDNILKEKRLRKMFLAKDKENRVHAVIYIIWDTNSAYYLMGGGDPVLRNSGATSLLLWEAIKFASTVTRNFDFEGSMIESVERFFRGFGAIQKPYFAISKECSKSLKVCMQIKNLLRTIIKE